MTVDSLIFWLFVAAWLIVGGIFAFVLLPRIVRSGLGIVHRITGMIDESALPLQFAKAEADVVRIGVSLARVDALRARAEAAIGTIRSTSLVPPALLELIARISAEIRVLRASAR